MFRPRRNSQRCHRLGSIRTFHRHLLRHLPIWLVGMGDQKSGNMWTDRLDGQKVKEGKVLEFFN